MTRTTKHIRESGATTIKRGGKIVGNIGSGKNPPTTPINPTYILTTQPNIDSTHTSKMFDKTTVQVLWDMSEGRPVSERLTLLSNVIGHLPAEEQRQFFQRTILTIQESIELYETLSQPGDKENEIPANIVNLLAFSGDLLIVEFAASNEKISPKTLTFLAGKKYISIKIAVAGNRNTPSQTLQKLSVERSTPMRAKIAANPNTPLSVLKRYLQLKDVIVHIGIAKNPTITTEMCEQMSKCPSLSVRMNLAHNSATPDKILEHFAKNSPQQQLRLAAQQELEHRKK